MSTHSPHFLKAHSPGAGQLGVLLLLQAWSQGSQPNGGRCGRGSRAHRVTLLPSISREVKGKDKQTFGPTQRTLPLIICILDPF